MKQGEELKVKKLVDRHVHLRDFSNFDGADGMMSLVASYTFRQCSSAIIMPNTHPIINTIDRATVHKSEIGIVQHIQKIQFNPYLTLYLTDNTDIDELEEGYKNGVWIAGKLYPKGATTNSENGVTDIKNIYPILDKMQKIGMPLLLHGEEVGDGISYYDRERMFVELTLPLLLYHFPGLKIVMEHVSTREAIDFVIENENIWATVTAHHLIKDKTVHESYKGEFDPFYFCLPVLNSKEDRLAIRKAVTSENKYIRKNFGAGTDSAPHLISDKLIKNKPGIFTGVHATELYTQVFIEENAKLGHLNDFLAMNLLEEVYRIRSTKDLYITLVKEEWEVPQDCNGIRPFIAGETLQWKIKSQIGR